MRGGSSLVTGGAGFIGSHLVDALLNRGGRVTVLDDLSNGNRANLAGALARGAVLEVGDIRDGERVAGLLAAWRPDAVFHLAAQIDVRVSVLRPAFDARTNVEGTINVLQGCVDAGVKRLVLASTGGAIYGESAVLPTPETVKPAPQAPYGQSKAAAEAYCALFRRLHGLSTVALRFGNVYGPRQDPEGEAGVIAIFCRRVLAGERPTVFGDGSQTRDYIYVRDVVDALVAAAGTGVSGEINVGTEQRTSVLELIDAVGAAAGERAVSWEPEFAAARLGEVQDSCLDASRARAVLGWRPRTSLVEGIRRTIEAMRQPG